MVPPPLSKEKLDFGPPLLYDLLHISKTCKIIHFHFERSITILSCSIFSSPGLSLGRAVVLPPASALASALAAALALAKC